MGPGPAFTMREWTPLREPANDAGGNSAGKAWGMARASGQAQRDVTPRRRQRDRNAETRLKLLDSAARTIYELGYAGASIGEIVTRAGLTKGAHLHHFKTKEQLMCALIEHLFAEVRAKQELVSRANPLMRDNVVDQATIEASLQAAAAAAFDWHFVCLLELWMASRTEPYLHKAFAECEARHAALRLQGLRATVGERAVAETDIGVILGGFNYILRGLFLQQILGGNWRENPSWIYWRSEVAGQIKSVLTSSDRAPAKRRRKPA